MAEEDPHVAVGRLRWPVLLADRVQTPEQNGPGIVETVQNGMTVYADVQAVGGLTFWGAQQTDTPITHRIYMRWHDYLENTKVIIRTTARPTGPARVETFRVRRIKELGGRKRFVMVEAELEKAP